MTTQMNNSKNTLNIGLMILMSTLVACGGGGGNSDSSGITSSAPVVEAVPETETEQPLTEPVEPETPSVITSTGELVAADSFLFQSNYKLDVMIDISSDYDYLTICFADEQSQPDYGDCLLRTDLAEGKANRELLLTNDTDSLLVVAWDYADIDNPTINSWNRALDGDLLQVN